ncbi:structural maintenance of chromosomes protein 3 [Dorcoceras hygrometricum]|uniref:Structural maintenance of chromosomes protein 3 n=1 Tax=Dorcoceras hygrometricum TaxID=472368 RepID=A0A2Z7A9C3_9LAMI|nr:structural maintenance of chromosomes protein 3 [Dorcoceras hygrometricum]
MASPFITNALQVNFESVLAISDNEGILNMFKALEASGLRGFLGCQSMLYETELEQFFDTALVQGGDITGAVSGKFFAISQSRIVEVFELPTEGLVDLSEVPKELVNDAKSIFSKSGQSISTYGKKILMKYEFRLLNDILSKSITVMAVNWSKILFGILKEMVDKTLKKDKGYVAQIYVLLKSNPVITMGEAVPFPSLKILSMKTVNTYVVMNETIDARGRSDEPSIATVAIVKRKSQSKKKSYSSEKAIGEAQVEVSSEKVVLRKRPTGDELVVTKKKRTSKSKASSSKTSTTMVTVAQDAVPLQIFEPTHATTAEQPPIPKYKSKKRRLVLSDDETIEERVAVETVENVQQHVTVEVTVKEPIVEHTAEEERHVSTHEGTITDDVDVIIGHVLGETSQLETIEGEQGEQHFDETAIGDIASGSSLVDQSDNLEQWFEDFVSRDAETVFTSNSDLDRGTGTVGTVADEEQLQVFVEKETVEKSAGSNPTDEEQMSLDDLLMQISDDMMLPSVTAPEITKIMSYLPVKIKEVQEHDWYYANLPKISATEKGKAPLEEADPVKGNPAREMVELICADVNFLVQMSDQVMHDVVEFFHSFSINKLSDLASLRALAEKEKFMLFWAKEDSLETAVRRRMYILAKYREMLLRKFLDSHRKYFTPGQTWTAMASQIIDLLSAAHSKSLEELQAQQQEHGIIMDRPSSSQLFKDFAGSSGAVLVQFYSLAKSICWPVQYWGAASSIINSWGWFRVCLDIVQYSMFGCLRPVRDENFCREIVAISSVVDVVEKLPSNLCRVIHQGQATNSFVGYFSDSDVQQGLNSNSDIDSVSSDCSTVYRSPYPQHDSFPSFQEAKTELSAHRESSSVPSVLVSDPNAQVDMVRRPDSHIPTVDSPMRFNSDDLSLDDTADNQFLLPAVTTELSASLDDPRTFLSQRLDTQTKDIRQIDDSQNDVLSKLNTLEKGLRDTLRHLEEIFRNLIQSARQDGRTLHDVQKLRFNEFRKGVLAQSGSVTTDLMDFRKEVKGLNAKVTYLDEQVATIRSEFLDFRAKAEENYLNLSTQLGDIVDYLRGGDAKKGEGSSSRPQPPPDDQDRPTGEGGANREAGIRGGVSGGDGRNRGGSGSSGSQSIGNMSDLQRKGDLVVSRLFMVLDMVHIHQPTFPKEVLNIG